MTLLRPFSIVFSQASSSSTQPICPSSNTLTMATNGFKGIAGFRKQIIGELAHVYTPHLCYHTVNAARIQLTCLLTRLAENCCFFSNIRGDISLIITHEPIGTYKAIVLSETNRRREVVISSDGNETVAKALEQLLTKSADAVQQFITTNGFSRLPADADNDDDGVSSVSSYVDEPDKDRLADSSLSLESEMESAYESPSEDGDDAVDYSRAARIGGRPRSYDVRTVLRDSDRSRSRRRSRSRSLSRERTTNQASYIRKAAAPAPPPMRYPPGPLHQLQTSHAMAQNIHGTRPVGRPPPGTFGPEHSGPVAYAGYMDTVLQHQHQHQHQRQMPPRPPMPMGAAAQRENWEAARRFSDNARAIASCNARTTELDMETRIANNAVDEAHAAEIRAQWHSNRAIDYAMANAKIVGGPQVPLPPPASFPPPRGGAYSSADDAWSPPPPFSGDMPPRGPGPMGVPPPMVNWQQPPHFQMFPGPRGQPPPRQPTSPVKTNPAPTPRAAMESPSITAASSSAASSTASSSVSSTPTITVSPLTPPEYSTSPPTSTTSSSPPAPSAKIDYRLVIKTPHSPSGGSASPQQEHRIIARTVPTRAAMRLVALRYVMQNAEAFRPAGLNAVNPARLRFMVTRAVLGGGDDESYDLQSYPEDDFSRLCEEGAAKKGGASGWPLFEIELTNSMTN